MKNIDPKSTPPIKVSNNTDEPTFANIITEVEKETSSTYTIKNKLAFLKSKNFIIPILILLSGITIFTILMITKPTANKLPRKEEAFLVEVIPARATIGATEIEAVGTIVPAVQIPLQSRITGQITEVSPNFYPGGIFKKDQKILQIDPSDFELALKQRQSELASIKANLQLELGNQSIAKAEYKLLAETLNAEDLTLVLRKPQIEIIQSQIKAAEAAVSRAELDLKRTTITAPFNGTILDRNVEIGAQVNQGTTFGNFVGIDKYWLETKIPVDQLRWLKFPKDDAYGSKVTISSPNTWGSSTIEGTLSHVAKNLEQSGRLLTAYISIDQPLEIAKTKNINIFLNSFVQLKIFGEKLENVIILPRKYLRGGDFAWVKNNNNQLEIRELKISFRGKDSVYVSEGLSNNDLIIKSNINSPVPGMLLRTASQ